MLELLLCSAVTILPDFLYRRFGQGKRIGREITLFSVWYELRWGITLCLVLTVSLITTIFYFHPSTTNAVSVFRTVTILPEMNGRVAETYVDINQRVEQGQPLFRLDSAEQEAAIETARRRIAEIDATAEVARAQLAEAEGRIVQARGALQQAIDEFEIRAELRRRNPDAISQRDVDRAQVAVDTQQGLVDAAIAGKAAVQSQLDFSSFPRRSRARRLRCGRRRSSSRRRSSWRAPRASCSSSRCARATWSTRCSGRPASSCPTASRLASSQASARSKRRS
jgi:multidrug resistance efflux pump